MKRQRCRREKAPRAREPPAQGMVRYRYCRQSASAIRLVGCNAAKSVGGGQFTPDACLELYAFTLSVLTRHVGKVSPMSVAGPMSPKTTASNQRETALRAGSVTAGLSTLMHPVRR